MNRSKQVQAVITGYAELDQRVERGEIRGHGNDEYQLLVTLIKDIGLDRATHPDAVTVDTLTAEQREVLVALTDGVWISVESVANVPSTWLRRAWLGLQAPSRFASLIRAHNTQSELESALEAVPRAERVEVVVEALLSRKLFTASWFTDALPRDAATTLDYAKHVLPQLPRASSLQTIALFCAFPASGTIVPHNCEAHFPLANNRFVLEHFGAVSEASRDIVLTNALRRASRVSGGPQEAALAVLEHYGALPLALDALRDYIARGKEAKTTGREKKRLTALHKRVKALA